MSPRPDLESSGEHLPRESAAERALEAGVWAPQWAPAQAWASRTLGSKPGSAFFDCMVLDKLLDP